MATPVIATGTAVPRLQVWANRPKKPTAASSLQILERSARSEPSSDFYGGLSEATAKALQKVEHTASFPAGAIIFMEGQPARGLYILRQGRVKLLTTNSDGRTLILKIAKPGEELGLNSVITGKPYDLTAEILQPAELAFLERADFLKCITEHGDACLHFASHLSRDCHAAYDLVRLIGLSQSVPERLARFLLDWSSNGSVMDGVLLMTSPMSVGMRFGPTCAGGALPGGRDAAPMQLGCARPMRRSRPEAPAAAGMAAVVHLGRD